MTTNSTEQKTETRHILHVADQLFYLRSGLAEGRSLEEATALCRKFERAFGEAWERVPHRYRADITKYWGGFVEPDPYAWADLAMGTIEEEELPRSRSRSPQTMPNIQLVNTWPGRGQTTDLGQLDNDASTLYFWAPAVEALPFDALVSLIVLCLAFVFVWASSEKVDEDPEKRAFAAQLALVWFGHGCGPLTRWKRSKAGKAFVAEWGMMLSLIGPDYHEQPKH